VSETLTVRREGDNVLLLLDGKLITGMPWWAAQKVWKAIRAKANEAEQHANPIRLITDQAYMYRTGAPFALTDDKDFQEEAFKEAQYNRDLRRYIPIPKADPDRGAESFGRPKITRKEN
jgi:hypothetical protein